MTNKERYRQAFGGLHTSGDFTSALMEKINGNSSDKIINMKEVTDMKKESKSTRKASRKIIAIAAAAAIVIGGALTAYAANIGGIQRTIQIWRYGEQTDAVLTIDDSSSTSHYTMEYTDENGESHVSEGGGVAFDIFGRERPLTEDEIMDHLDMPEFIVGDDGRAVVYWRSRSIDVTDRFNENGVCYITVSDGRMDYYITAHTDGSYCIDSDKYIIED